MTDTAKFSVSWEEYIDNLIEENKRLQSALDYANRDRESMHYKIVELWNKRESQRNMNYILRKQNKNLKEWNNELIEKHKKDIDVLCEENKELREENEILRCNKGWTPEKVWHEEMIQYLMKENKKLKGILNRIKELYEDEEEAELLNYLDENLDEI